MKRTTIIAVFLLIALLLSGCCIGHTVRLASCTGPEYCFDCGEYKGEALGHDWVDATCDSPKHCSRCNEWVGLPVNHQWAEWENDGITLSRRCASCQSLDSWNISDEYVEAQIAELGLIEDSRAKNGGRYTAVYFETQNGEPKVMICCIAKMMLSNGQYRYSVYDAFSKVIIFECISSQQLNTFPEEKNSALYERSYTSPYFKGAEIQISNALIQLERQFIEVDGGPEEYLAEYMPPCESEGVYLPDRYEYTDKEVAELYVRFVREKYRVTAEEIAQGLDMSDPDIRLLDISW